MTYVNKPDGFARKLLSLCQPFNERSRANWSGCAGCINDNVILSRGLLQQLYLIEILEQDGRHALRLVVLYMLGFSDEHAVREVLDIGMG